MLNAHAVVRFPKHGPLHCHQQSVACSIPLPCPAIPPPSTDPICPLLPSSPFPLPWSYPSHPVTRQPVLQCKPSVPPTDPYCTLPPLLSPPITAPDGQGNATLLPHTDPYCTPPPIPCPPHPPPSCITSQTAKSYCREVVRILRILKAKRDMSVNEARLIVSIEDPRTREQRQLGIEVSLGPVAGGGGGLCCFFGGVTGG